MKKEETSNQPKIYQEQGNQELSKMQIKKNTVNLMEMTEDKEEVLQPKPVRNLTEWTIAAGSHQLVDVQLCLDREMVDMEPCHDDPRLP